MGRDDGTFGVREVGLGGWGVCEYADWVREMGCVWPGMW